MRQIPNGWLLVIAILLPVPTVTAHAQELDSEAWVLVVGADLATLFENRGLRIIEATPVDESTGAIQHPEAWNEALQAIQAAYQNFEFAAARARAESLRREVQSAARSPSDFEMLYEVHLLCGVLDLTLQRPDSADDAFREAILLRPEAALDEGRYPPDVRERYAAVQALVREDISTPPATLPPAETSTIVDEFISIPFPQLGDIDSDLRSRLQAAIEGPTVLRAHREGDALAIASLDLASGEVQTTHGLITDLDRMLAELRPPAPREPTPVLDPVAGPHQPGLETEAFLPAESEPPAAEERERPLLRSPWLWTAVGLVIVGAATGTAVALSRDSAARLHFR